jgi:type IV secretory pathway VirB3-like protein
MEPDDEPPLDTVVLHVAACRPAMTHGIPWTLIIPVVFVCVEIEMIFGMKMAIAMDLPLIITMFLMVRHDYNAPRLWLVWLRTRCIILDDERYGGVAISHHPIKPEADTYRGIPSDAWR